MSPETSPQSGGKGGPDVRLVREAEVDGREPVAFGGTAGMDLSAVPHDPKAYNREAFERFMGSVDRSGECWLWRGNIALNGYGRFGVGGKLVYAHRYSYEHLASTIPDGYQIDHLCRVRSCVRPSHLEAVPPRVNNLRSQSPSAANARKTHCKRGHEFTPENTIVIPSTGHRRCRTCMAFLLKRNAERRKKNGLPSGDPRHGTSNGYVNFSCKCGPCREAGSYS